MNNSLKISKVYQINYLVFFFLILRGLYLGVEVAFDSVNDNVMRAMLILNTLILSLRNIKISIYSIIFLFYVFLYSGISLLNGTRIGDVINSQLLFIYFFLFFPVSNLNYIINKKILLQAFKFCVWLFLMVYAWMKIQGINRPFVMVENNFELLLIGIVALTISQYEGKRLFLWIFLIITVISGSKSAFLIGIFMLLRTYFSQLFWVTLFGVVFGFIYISFFGIDVGRIDRLTFLNVFIQEVSMRSSFHVLMPMELRPLSYTNGLDYYTGSLTLDNTYYPKVLHSWWLSAILNHGILIVSSYLIIFNSKLSKMIGTNGATLILIIVGLNALSISAFDSIWFWFALLLVWPLWKIDSRVCRT